MLNTFYLTFIDKLMYDNHDNMTCTTFYNQLLTAYLEILQNQKYFYNYGYQLLDNLHLGFFQ